MAAPRGRAPSRPTVHFPRAIFSVPRTERQRWLRWRGERCSIGPHRIPTGPTCSTLKPERSTPAPPRQLPPNPNCHACCTGRLRAKDRLRSVSQDDRLSAFPIELDKAMVRLRVASIGQFLLKRGGDMSIELFHATRHLPRPKASTRDSSYSLVILVAQKWST